MAKRLCFFSKFNDDIFYEQEFEFEYFNGFAITQKHKSIDSFHNEILKIYPQAKVVEVSRKSKNLIGVKLSAFNLKIYNAQYNKYLPVECVFQSSKVFENGIQYKDLLLVEPIIAKRDERLKTSGKIIAFNYEGIEYPNVPRTLFYDWIYINALWQNKEILEELAKYDAFTDIEFNQNKSLNCQARSCAIAVSLFKQGLLEDYLKDLDLFKSIYKGTDPLIEQMTLF